RTFGPRQSLYRRRSRPPEWRPSRQERVRRPRSSPRARQRVASCSPPSLRSNKATTHFVAGKSRELASFPVIPSPLPHEPRSYPAGGASVEISLLEVDAAVAPRDPRLISRVRERRPGKHEVPPRNGSRFDPRAAGRERHRGAEAVGMRKELEDLRAGGAEVAVAGRVLRERWRRKRWRLVGKPGRTVDELRALVRAGPGAHHLAAEECANRRDGTNGVEGTLVIPRATAPIGHGVRERKEELHVPLESMLVIAVVIAARDVLREQIPVSGWKGTRISIGSFAAT